MGDLLLARSGAKVFLGGISALRVRGEGPDTLWSDETKLVTISRNLGMEHPVTVLKM